MYNFEYIRAGSVEEALEGLRERYPSAGLQVVRVAGGYQLCTRPEHAEVVSGDVPR